MGFLFVDACWSSIFPALTIIERGSSFELGKRDFNSTNSLFQIFSFSLAETVAPRGTQSVNCICEPLFKVLPADSPVKTSSRRAPSAEAGTMALA